MIDFSTGIMAALGLMVGLFQAQRTGKGCDLDVSLFDTSASVLNYLAIWNLNKGYTPEKTRYSAHPSLVPSQLFPTSDGYIVVMCNKEKFFPLLCEQIGAPHLADDPRYRTFTLRLENRESLVAQLVEIFAQHNADHWIALLSGKIPAAKVNSVEQGMNHPLMKERNMIVNVEHPAQGPLRMLGTPIKVSDYQPDYKPGPALGANNEEIYSELAGLNQEDIARLRQQGIIG